ncbi:MAG: sigma-70 family RNA polymerase sigma factor [Lachnospiraceae bacterium]|nr:sigma-70 family RNA polymerase sigma factor [Lachnospiraceae bacterium]
MVMSDEAIIELFWNRSESALSETKKKYASLLRTIANNILHNFLDAEECENDTYLHTWESIPPLRPINLKAYLAKIVRNLAIGKLRKNLAKKRGGGIIITPYEELEECIPDERSAEAPDMEKLRESLDSFLQMLPKEQRIIFMKRYWYSYSVNEIARQTGRKEKYITNHLYLLRKKLKQYLERRDISL